MEKQIFNMKILTNHKKNDIKYRTDSNQTFFRSKLFDKGDSGYETNFENILHFIKEQISFQLSRVIYIGRRNKRLNYWPIKN